MKALRLYVLGLVVVSLCFIAFSLLQSDATRSQSGDLTHRLLHILYNAATDSSRKPYHLEDITVSYTNSSDELMARSDAELSGDPMHRRFDVSATHSSRKLHYRDNLTIPTVSSTRSSDELTTRRDAESNDSTRRWFDVAPHSSRRVHHLENRAFPTVSSTKSIDELMPVVREGRPSSIILNKTARGKVTSTETMSHSPTLWSVPETCKEPNCAEFLSQDEKLAIRRCERRAVEELPGYEVQRSSCKFLPGNNRSRMTLISAEGSGNTWLRGLLEKATGVCTGFCCCDIAMRARGFIGESVKSGKVLVVKSHDTAPWTRDWREGLHAVFLLRNPAHSLIADRNRRVTDEEERRKGLPRNDSHTNVVSKEQFVSRDWDQFIKLYLHMWELRLTNWVLNHDRPVHVVKYEDLQNDKVKEVEKILDFLHFSYDHDDIVAALKEDYSVFQRSHKHDHFQHYSARQKEYIRTTLLRMQKSASQRGKAHLLHLDEYLESLPHIDESNIF